jgi:antitoxin ParD1/3/4
MPTRTMNISLPDSMKSYVEELLSEGGYGSVSEYVRELIRADQLRREAEKLDRLLLQRLAADDRQFSIDDVKSELTKRLAKSK